MDFLLENNVNYSINLFRYATKNKIPFIYASSAATYGAGEKGYLDDPSVMDQLRPINPYGFSKKLFDSWVLRQTEKPPLFIGLKFFNVYGPNEGHKDHMQSVVAKAVPQILQTGRLKLFKSYKDGIGHGEQQRDFIYIKDVVEVLGDLIEKAERKSAEVSSGIYNLGTGVPRSFADLGCAVFAALEKQSIKTVLLSGDHDEIAQKMAQQVGIENAQGAMDPTEKHEYLELLKAKNHRVLMVGDGLNDAPVLSAADVSMAPGSAIDMALKQTRGNKM